MLQQRRQVNLPLESVQKVVKSSLLSVWLLDSTAFAAFNLFVDIFLNCLQNFTGWLRSTTKKYSQTSLVSKSLLIEVTTMYNDQYTPEEHSVAMEVANRLLHADYLLIDTRSTHEYAGCRVIGSISCPSPASFADFTKPNFSLSDVGLCMNASDHTYLMGDYHRPGQVTNNNIKQHQYYLGIYTLPILPQLRWLFDWVVITTNMVMYVLYLLYVT